MLGNFFDHIIDFLSLGLPPNVRCRFEARFLDRRTREFMQQNAVGVLSARVLGINVLVLHMLVREPAFNLLIGRSK